MIADEILPTALVLVVVVLMMALGLSLFPTAVDAYQVLGL